MGSQEPNGPCRGKHATLSNPQYFLDPVFTMTPHTEIFNDLLKLAVDSDVSDIVIKTNKLGYVRLAGQLKPVDMDPIQGDEARAFVEEHVPKVFRPI
jgi:hypothetical protein